MEVQHGIAIVFGIKPQRPIKNLPKGARVRVRLRERKPGKAFVKLSDRIEEWVLGFEDNNLKNDWVLKFRTGTNYL